MAVFVKFWGTRGSIPTPGSSTRTYGGNTSCVELRTESALVVCDAGTGLRELGLDLLRRGGDAITGHLFFSHAHWDHIQGFPFFAPAYLPQNTFVIYGSEVRERSMHSLLSGQMQSDYFPVEFSNLGARVLPGELTRGLQVGDVRVTSRRQWHPGSSLGFCFETQGRKVVYSTDNELDLALTNEEECARDLSALRRLPEDFVEFVRGADLLIADGQYTEDEYPKKRGWGHARATTVVDLAVAAGVRQLAITHHDPMHTDRDVDALIETCRARAARLSDRPPLVFGARESMELKIE
jgi:phosphoribosyl 1,2-cyclic phosphodiesterase